MLNEAPGSENNEPDWADPFVAPPPYTDRGGTVLYQRAILRIPEPPYTQEFLRRPNGKGGWTYKGAMKAFKKFPVLYRLPAVLEQAECGQPILVVQTNEVLCNWIAGEREYRGIDIVATTTYGEDWQQSYSDALRGAAVFIVPTGDAPSKQWAARVAACLRVSRITAKLLELPDLSNTYDTLEDWIKGGRGSWESLKALMDEALPWQPDQSGDTPNIQSSGGERISQKNLVLTAAGQAERAGALELWHDGNNEGWASISEGGCFENIKMRSRSFKSFLAKRVYFESSIAVSTQALDDALSCLEATAKWRRRQHEPELRIAGNHEASLLHLADAAGTIVQVTTNGCALVDGTPPCKFFRPKGMLPLPQPVFPKSIDAAKELLATMRDYCNIAEDQEWLLFLVCLLVALRPRGPFPVVLIVGEQGSAKSTTAKVFRKLTDPSKAPLRSAPKAEQDLWISATNSWVVVFDNVSRISADLSDLICRLSTGGGNSYRTLFENDEETIFSCTRMVVITAIDDFRLRGDLADRVVRLNCAPIDESHRKTEQEFWSAFEKQEPQFLGALLLVLSATLKMLPSVRLDRLPRMADFAYFGVAVEKALELEEGAFLNAYNGNRKDAVEALLDNPIAKAITGLVDGGRIEMQPSELRKELKRAILSVEGSGKDDDVLDGFPRSAATLTSWLRRRAPAFRARGIEIGFGKSGKRRTTIRKVAIQSSTSSESSNGSQEHGFEPDDDSRSIVHKRPGIVRLSCLDDEMDDSGRRSDDAIQTSNEAQGERLDDVDDSDDDFANPCMPPGAVDI